MSKLYNKLTSEFERAKLINQYDYDTMLNHFDRMKSIEVIKNQKKSEISKINKKWEEKAMQISLNPPIKSNKSNEKSFHTLEDESKLFKQAHSEKNTSKIRNYNTLDHHQLSQVKEEENRIKLEMSINSKLKKISEKNTTNKEKLKIKLNKRLGEDFYKYKDKLKEIEEDKITKLKEKEKIEFDKYNFYQSHLNDQKKKSEEKLIKENLKLEKFYENCVSMDRLNEEKIKEKLSRIFDNREEEKIKFSNLRVKPLIEKIEKNHSRFFDKIKVIEARRMRRERHLLNKESKLIKKTKLKEKESAKQKLDLYGRILNDQLDLKKKFLEMNSHVNSISSQNINSMSVTERKEYYKELKRQEEEERKRLIEEQNNLNK